MRKGKSRRKTSATDVPKIDNVVKLVTHADEDCSSVMDVLHGALSRAKDMKVTEAIVILRNKDGEVFTPGHWTDDDRMIGLLEIAKFELMSEWYMQADEDDED